MKRITEKQLIEQIKTLKNIKPNQEWAVLLKSQILVEKQVAEVINAEIKVVEQPEKSIGIMEVLSFMFTQRKLAYSFAVVLLFVVGVFGFSEYVMPGDLSSPAKKVAEQSQATLTGQTQLKQDVAILNSKINDLGQLTKEGRTNNIPSAMSEINANVSELTKSLKSSSVKDPQTIKDIASSLKILADMPGTDLTTNSDIKDLYQTIVQSQIDDLRKTTLTDDQKDILTQVEDLYKNGKYTDALEKILLINK